MLQPMRGIGDRLAGERGDRHRLQEAVGRCRIDLHYDRVAGRRHPFGHRPVAIREGIAAGDDMEGRRQIVQNGQARQSERIVARGAGFEILIQEIGQLERATGPFPRGVT